MLDMRFIREHAAQVKLGAQRKGFGKVDIDRLLQVDADLRLAKQGLQELATKKNKAGGAMRIAKTSPANWLRSFPFPLRKFCSPPPESLAYHCLRKRLPPPSA